MGRIKRNKLLTLFLQKKKKVVLESEEVIFEKKEGSSGLCNQVRELIGGYT